MIYLALLLGTITVAGVLLALVSDLVAPPRGPLAGSAHSRWRGRP